MLARCLHHAGLDPTIVIGGRLDSIGSSARRGAGEFLVAEADESDGSFVYIPSTYSIITNIDREHMDYYRSMSELNSYFLNFVKNH